MRLPFSSTTWTSSHRSWGTICVGFLWAFIYRKHMLSILVLENVPILSIYAPYCLPPTAREKKKKKKELYFLSHFGTTNKEGRSTHPKRINWMATPYPMPKYCCPAKYRTSLVERVCAYEWRWCPNSPSSIWRKSCNEINWHYSGTLWSSINDLNTSINTKAWRKRTVKAKAG